MINERIKKISIMVVICLVGTVLVVSLVYGFSLIKAKEREGNNTNIYDLYTHIIETNGDVVKVLDRRNNIWEFRDSESSHEIGEVVILEMDDNNTLDITDDVIVSVQYGE